MKVSACQQYIDFLGYSANNYGSEYYKDICCFVFKSQEATALPDILNHIVSSTYEPFNCSIKNVVDPDGKNYSFKLYDTNITVRTEIEPDEPICYEALFNESVSANFEKSPWFSASWQDYNESSGTVDIYNSKTTSYSTIDVSSYLTNDYISSRRISSGFNESEFLVHDIKTNDIIHDISYLESENVKFTSAYNLNADFAVICITNQFDNLKNTTAINDFKELIKTAIPVSLINFEKTISINSNNMYLQANTLGLIAVN